MRRKQQTYKHDEQEKPSRKVRLEIYIDGLYYDILRTDLTVKDGQELDEETIREYVETRMPSFKKKRWTAHVL